MASNSDNRAAFTPGPWRLNNGTVLGADGVGVTRPIERFDGASEANARLIAAAPSMFAELVRLRDRIEADIRGPLPISEREHDDYIKLCNVIGLAQIGGAS